MRPLLPAAISFVATLVVCAATSAQVVAVRADPICGVEAAALGNAMAGRAPTLRIATEAPLVLSVAKPGSSDCFVALLEDGETLSRARLGPAPVGMDAAASAGVWLLDEWAASRSDRARGENTAALTGSADTGDPARGGPAGDSRNGGGSTGGPNGGGSTGGGPDGGGSTGGGPDASGPTGGGPGDGGPDEESVDARASVDATVKGPGDEAVSPPTENANAGEAGLGVEPSTEVGRAPGRDTTETATAVAAGPGRPTEASGEPGGSAAPAIADVSAGVHDGTGAPTDGGATWFPSAHASVAVTLLNGELVTAPGATLEVISVGPVRLGVSGALAAGTVPGQVTYTLDDIEQTPQLHYWHVGPWAGLHTRLGRFTLEGRLLMAAAKVTGTVSDDAFSEVESADWALSTVATVRAGVDWDGLVVGGAVGYRVVAPAPAAIGPDSRAFSAPVAQLTVGWRR